mgnify:CR=1 FL=1
MKKIFTLFAIFACLPILLSAKGPAVIGGSTYTADTLSHYNCLLYTSDAADEL